MKKKKKYIIISLLTGFILVIVFSIGADHYLAYTIKKTLNTELAEDYHVLNFQVEVNSRSGSVFIEQLYIQKKNEDSTAIQITDLALRDISIYQWLVHDQLIVHSFYAEDISLSVEESSELLKAKANNTKASEPKLKHIQIKNIHIENLNAKLFSTTSNQAIFNIADMALRCSNLKINQNPDANNLPVWFDEFALKNGKLSYLLGEFNKLEINEITYAQQNISLTNVSLQTIYSKQEFSKQIEIEQDHYNLVIPSIKLFNFEALKEAERFHIKSTQLLVSQPILHVYRDKQLKESTAFKPIYSKSLRELPIKLSIDSAQVNEASITYEEKVKKNKAAGKINLSKLNASISNLSNTYPPNTQKTTIKAKSLFMEKTPLDAEWSFDVNSTTDEFSFKAELGKLAADSFNGFTENHLKVLLEGQLEKTYLTIHGNNDNSTTNMKLAYEDFKVKLIDDDGNKKNILSGILNIFISDGSDGDEKKDIQGKAKRIKSKSFFNFLWVSIRSALKKLI